MSISKIEIDRRLASVSLEALKEKVARATEERKELLNRQHELDEQISSLSSEIVRLEKILDNSAQKGPSGKRRRKGQNRREILDLLRSLPPGRGMTAKEIAEHLDMPFGSARSVLEKDKNEFIKDANGLWFLKERIEEANEKAARDDLPF